MECDEQCTPKKSWSMLKKVEIVDASKRLLHAASDICEIRNKLREKCKGRVKNTRQSLFVANRLQSFDNHENTEKDKEMIMEVIRDEIAEYEFDIALQEKIYEELLMDANSWIIDEIEKEENYLIESVHTHNQIFCPICQRSILQFSDQIFSCSCGIQFHFNGNEMCLQNAIQTILGAHNQRGCENQLQFFVEPFNQQNACILNVICLCCDFYRQIGN